MLDAASCVLDSQKRLKKKKKNSTKGPFSATKRTVCVNGLMDKNVNGQVVNMWGIDVEQLPKDITILYCI